MISTYNKSETSYNMKVKHIMKIQIFATFQHLTYGIHSSKGELSSKTEDNWNNHKR